MKLQEKQILNYLNMQVNWSLVVKLPERGDDWTNPDLSSLAVFSKNPMEFRLQRESIVVKTIYVQIGHRW